MTSIAIRHYLLYIIPKLEGLPIYCTVSLLVQWGNVKAESHEFAEFTLKKL